MLRKAIMRLRKTRFRALIQRNLLKITYQRIGLLEMPSAEEEFATAKSPKAEQK